MAGRKSIKKELDFYGLIAQLRTDYENNQKNIESINVQIKKMDDSIEAKKLRSKNLQQQRKVFEDRLYQPLIKILIKLSDKSGVPVHDIIFKLCDDYGFNIKNIKSKASQPEEIQPKASQPEDIQPKASQPEDIQPKASQPEEIQPKASQPDISSTDIKKRAFTQSKKFVSPTEKFN